MPLRKFYTAHDVPREYFKENRYIYAFCERVIDGDTIRVRHVPGYAWRRRNSSVLQPLQQRGIAEDTLSIRIYAVDTPEKSQPYADEAKEFTSNLVHHKMVKVTFLRRDQYGRAVAQVETVPSRSWIPLRRFFTRGGRAMDVSLQLAKEGLAELYTGGGAEYHERRDMIERAIGKAQAQSKGIWSAPGEQRISAANFKRAKRQGQTTPAAAPSSSFPGARAPTTSSSNKWTTTKPRSSTKTTQQPKRQRTALGLSKINPNHGAKSKVTTKQANHGAKENDKTASNVLELAMTGLEFMG